MFFVGMLLVEFSGYDLKTWMANLFKFKFSFATIKKNSYK